VIREREEEEMVFVFVLEIAGIIIAIIAVCTKRTFFPPPFVWGMGMGHSHTLSLFLSVLPLCLKLPKLMSNKVLAFFWKCLAVHRHSFIHSSTLYTHNTSATYFQIATTHTLLITQTMYFTLCFFNIMFPPFLFTICFEL